MTIQDVAHHLGVSWDAIKDIQKRHLERRFKRIRRKDRKQNAIDEISTPGGGKGHGNRTVVLDLLSGAVRFIGEGKGADVLEPFWRKLQASGGGVPGAGLRGRSSGGRPPGAGLRGRGSGGGPRAPASRRPPAT